MDFVERRLIGAFDDHLVDADVRRTARHPDQRLGDVRGGEGIDAFINFLGARSIAAETHDGKFRLGQAGIERGDTHAGAGQFQPQRTSDEQLARLGPAIREPPSYAVREAMEPMLMMELPGFLTRSGKAARVMRNTPSTFVCIMNSQSSSLPSATLSRPFAPPALLMSTSSLSVCWRANSAKAFTLGVEDTSSA